MNYIFMPSLKHIALVRIASILWSQNDISDLAEKFFIPVLPHSERQKEWQIIENKVMEKVPKLSLPDKIKNKVLDFIKPIGHEILKWRKYLEIIFDRRFVRESLNKAYWTPQGTIDKKKTAESLIKDESLHITQRYILACICCLEKYIPALWNKMPQNLRQMFYCNIDPSNNKQNGLVVAWTYEIKGDVAKLEKIIENRWRKCTLYQYAFELAVTDANKAATEYFLQKLTLEEREDSLVRSIIDADYMYDSINTDDSHMFSKKYYADVICFLLSQMNEDQQIKVFTKCSYGILTFLLDWPWQGFFIDTAKLMWTFLPKVYYVSLLRKINRRAIDGNKDCNYQKIFGEFWQQSPITYKEYIIKNFATTLLSKLFQINDKENIALILKYATLAEKEFWTHMYLQKFSLKQ